MINLIPVVFAGDDDVIKQRKSFYDCINTSDRSEKAADKMAKEKIKLLESIAKPLGYDKNVNWETIGDSYYTENLAEESRLNEQMRLATLSLVHQMENNVNKNK